ncbi:MAG: hypothetical protein IKU15_00220 [Clostridia bacterium]|nr:hypothetical protein [Clostridia bacterium]
MIKNIIYVEAGSVDCDELVDSLDETTKVIIYRQGSNPPILTQPTQPINSYTDSMYEHQNTKLERVRKDLEKCGEMKMSKKLRNLLITLYADLFC